MRKDLLGDALRTVRRMTPADKARCTAMGGAVSGTGGTVILSGEDALFRESQRRIDTKPRRLTGTFSCGGFGVHGANGYTTIPVHSSIHIPRAIHKRARDKPANVDDAALIAIARGEGGYEDFVEYRQAFGTFLGCARTLENRKKLKQLSPEESDRIRMQANLAYSTLIHLDTNTLLKNAFDLLGMKHSETVRQMRTGKSLLDAVQNVLLDNLGDFDPQNALVKSLYSTYRRLLVQLNRGEPGGIFEAYSGHKPGDTRGIKPIVPNAIRGMPFSPRGYKR